MSFPATIVKISRITIFVILSCCFEILFFRDFDLVRADVVLVFFSLACFLPLAFFSLGIYVKEEKKKLF